MTRLLTITLFNLLLTVASSSAIDLSEVVKDGGGYKIVSVEFKHDFEKGSFSVIRNSKGDPLMLNGLVTEKNIQIEVSVPFSDGKPVAYTLKKWKKITHPDLSDEGEISDVLVSAQSGLFEKLQNEVKDARLKRVFEQAIKQIAKTSK